MFEEGFVKALFAGLLALSMMSCTPAPRHQDTYTSPSGEVKVLESDRDSCLRSCNDDFDRCSDTRASQEQVGRGQMTGVFGGRADCRDDMRSCLARCKTAKDNFAVEP